MEPLIYFFGISRGEKTFVLTDSITIKNDFMISEPYYIDLEALFSEKKINIKNLIEEFRRSRGLLFGAAKSSDNISKFLSYGKLLSPDIREKKFSIFFFDKKKSILFKVNKQCETVKKIRNETWALLKPLAIVNEKEFKKSTMDLEGPDYENTYVIEPGRLKISIGNYHYLFICIKPKDYNQLKSRIKKMYKGIDSR